MQNDSSRRVRNRRVAVLTAAASAAVLALVAPCAALAAPSSSVALSGGGDSGSGDSCDLVNSTVTATSTVNAGLTQQFNDYANTGGAWTGGDSTYSLPLSDGRLGWFFSDTFLGIVNPDGSRPTDTTFVNQSIVVDDAGTLSTVTGGTPSAPDSIVPPTPEGKWHWLGDPAEGKHGDVQIPLLQFEKFGPDLWDFRWTANRLATLDGDTLALEEVTELPSATGTNWTSYTLQEGSKTYVYGIRDIDGVRSAFVARVTGNDGLKGNWKFWDGDSWSNSEADAVPVASYVSNEFSVEPFHDGYILITHDTTWAFDNRVVAQASCSPTGPFVFATELFRAPESGLWGSYGDQDVYTYNSHEHVELRDGDTLLVTYNVNTFDNVGDIYDDASIYRPRFYDVQLTVTP